jgi:hypothetical protein
MKKYYNFTLCFFKLVGQFNGYNGDVNQRPTLWQWLWSWRVSPKLAYEIASIIWLDNLKYDL